MMRTPSAIFVGLALAGALAAAPAAYAASPSLEEQATAAGSIAGSVAVEVGGETTTYLDLQQALNVANNASSTETVTVTLAKNSTYEISSKLRIYSNTVLDLNGATIKRMEAGITDGMIYNYPVGWRGSSGVQRSDKAAGGYNMSTNITVKNGTLDGGDTSVIKKAQGAADLLRIDHASGVHIENVDFKNVYDCHHVEFVGVKDGTISNCTFSGFKFQVGKENNAEYGREAIELDAAWTNNPSDLSDAKSMWAKDTCLDMTANQNCVVEGCTFTDLPSAVGGHHWSASKGYENSSNIEIKNNTITAPASRKNYKTAITAGGIDNLKVTGNKVTGPYAFSVHAYRASSIAIASNTFDGAKKNSIMVDGKAKKVTVDSNKVANAAQHAISTLDCSVKSISKNTITSPKANGITVSSGTVTAIKGNKVTGAYKNAISVVGGTVGTKGKANTGILSNTVSKTKVGNGITVSSQATVANISSNKIANPKKNGISIVDKAKVTAVKSNTITKKSGKFGIYVGSKQAKTKVQKNKIAVSLEKYGIGIGSGVKATLSGNTITVK